jgi:D-erythronate 2-dehydrogenase
MVQVLIIGAAGMLGRKLTQRLVRDGKLAGQMIEKLILSDIVVPAGSSPGSVEIVTKACDYSVPGCADDLIHSRPDFVFHLAAVVSGEAEADFEKGYAVNLDGTRQLFEAIRRIEDYCPRVVFTSSVAAFGAPLPDEVPDDFHLTPLTSYGTQKAICELLLADFTRRGFMDGVGIRLPTICVRPGRPNKAASGFFSGIIREPLNGQEAVLPVETTVRHWFASPRAAVGFMIRAAELDGRSIGHRRNLTMPGVSATVGEEIEALRRVAGGCAVKLIRHVADEKVKAIIETWPRSFDARRAIDLGFAADSNFDEIVRVYAEDELGLTGTINRAAMPTK